MHTANYKNTSFLYDTMYEMANCQTIKQKQTNKNPVPIIIKEIKHNSQLLMHIE